MSLWLVVISAVVSYLSGSISFARIVSHFKSTQADLDDVTLVTEDGSKTHHLHTIGATTAAVKYGSKTGCLIGIMDILKALIPVLVFRLLYPDGYYHLIAAVCAIIGHVWPVYYRFHGGAGISPTYGGLLVVDFLGAIVSSVAGMLFGLFIVRDIFVAYLSGLWFVIVWFVFTKGDLPHILYGAAINIIIILAMIPDIKNYWKVRKEGNLDISEAMATFPMGRGMLKIMGFFKIKPRKWTGKK